MGFPTGTIHIVDVTAPKNDDNPYIVVRHNGQYYICMDNGLPRALFGDDVREAVAIDIGDYREKNFRTFAAYDIYCKAAVMLAQGADLADIGTPLEAFCPYTPNQPVLLDGVLKAYIAYIDDYGNATLNITYDEFEQIRANRTFELWVREVKLTEVVRSYSHSRGIGNSKNAILLTVSATGYLQVAMKQYSTEQYFGVGLELQESVIVRFGEVVPTDAGNHAQI
jgi:S-adenosylmethionine hydrolase